MERAHCLSVFSQSFVTDFSYHGKIIQLMHSSDIIMRICQPENSDVHRGDVEVNIFSRVD